MTHVLLSIRPEWAEAILAGEKRYEYRRAPPALDTPYYVLLYATDPLREIVGHAWTPVVIEGTPGEVIEETIDETPHDAAEIREYFGDAESVGGMEMVDPVSYETTVPLDVLRRVDVEPGQNFRYIREFPSQIVGYFPSEVVPA